MGKFILIDLKKRDEHKRLKKLGPSLLQKMDMWIVQFDDGTPTAEECQTAEEQKIVELITEYDAQAKELGRVQEEIQLEREDFVKHLGWKRGKLYRKFGDTIAALKDQAIETLQHCDELWKSFQKEMIASFPVAEETIAQEVTEFLAETTQYVQDTFPDGVEGLDAFDDGLPDGVPSFNKFQRMVMESQAKLKAANYDAIPRELEKIKAASKVGFKTAINEAIQKAVADIVVDLSDDSLPYLGEEEMEAFRKELIQSAEEYGASRIDK